MPFLAIIAYKFPKIGFLLGFVLIFVNMAINFITSYHYDLKLGFLHAKNVNLLQGIIGKPWVHL